MRHIQNEKHVILEIITNITGRWGIMCTGKIPETKQTFYYKNLPK